MKQSNHSKLWISLLLLLSCLGAFYFAVVASRGNEQLSLSSEIHATSETTMISTEEENVTTDNISIPAELSGFADVDILKYQSNPQALALLVSRGGLRPVGENLYAPHAEVSLIEFLDLSLHWLKHRSGDTFPESQVVSAGTSGIVFPSSATGEALHPDILSTYGFGSKSETILKAADYGIPVFSASPEHYDRPVQYGQAAFILVKLAENALMESFPEESDPEHYLENAFFLRLYPYYDEIGKALSSGLLSAQEFSSLAPELPLSRSQTANLLTRLFDPSARVSNPALEASFRSIDMNYYSKAVYLFNNDRKLPVVSYNENLRLPPASLTKIMTVYVAIEMIPDRNAKVNVSSAFRQKMLRSGASIAGFYGNERVTYQDLLYATFLSSGAEAAGTLAIRLAGSEAAFIEKMNQKAAELGMNNTRFQTVEGLDAPDQYTTARDIALLMESALKNPVFYEIASTAHYTTSRTRSHPKGLALHSTVLKNIRANDENGFHILGGKSGTTSLAGLCWATFAEKDGETYILVTLGAPLDNLYNPTMYQKMDALYIYRQISGKSE